MSRRSIRAAVALATVAVLAVAMGCESMKRTGERALFSANPVGSTDGVVLGVSRHGSYLLVAFGGSLRDMQFFAPATADCLQVLAPEVQVRYTKSGVFGRFTRDGTSCDPIGVASLAAWRDSRPRTRGKPVPRAAAFFTLLQEDPELIFLRGRFPLASRVGIPGGWDFVAVLPNSGVCSGLAQRTEASLEFRPAGPEPFVLLNSGQRCPVLGFTAPIVAAGTAEP